LGVRKVGEKATKTDLETTKNDQKRHWDAGLDDSGVANPGKKLGRS